MRLEDISVGVRLGGVNSRDVVTVLATLWHGPDALQLTYRNVVSGQLGERVLYRGDESGVRLASERTRPFDAPAEDFRLAAEAQRIKLAGLYDPMLAVATSDVEPLPHQIRAVYGEMLPRSPLRFLLADDPGAGKTIMAGLYIKELILRDDVRRCLIVAPGGLVEQWQDELDFKFGLRFTILTAQLWESSPSVFQEHPLLIARMDQLSRNDVLQQHLADSEWDLVVVDEAHRMGARYYGKKVDKTKRFLLGELLGRISRHLLLMTATPHSGKEEDFQLFLTLLDRDRFEGRYRSPMHRRDTTGLMRRMVKEDLLTFEGKPLFPDRIAQTVPYELTAAEQDLYEHVTTYVREGMNRAEKLNSQRRNTVGFALTVLQRRLASSPEAIYQSLVRRVERLSRRRQLLLDGVSIEDQATPDLDDIDEYTAEEIEGWEEQVVDSATAAQTVAELDAELVELGELVQLAQSVRDSGTDRKWTELRTLLEDKALPPAADGRPRKLIVFTEHRDTLHYLAGRIRSLIGRPEAVAAIHGGVGRRDRRGITEEFTKNPEVQVLMATDAAGEGLNLQVAHLMVNYDLPWNPNRIEQRFGRIHRIGQKETCHLWNLVASNTREGEVFQTLLAKVEEQRQAYGGKVFDVLGAAFAEEPLRKLLLDAIRFGESPEVRAKMERVIDARVSDGLRELLTERALAHDAMRESDVAQVQRLMDEARARRLQPHYIEGAFREGFKRLGGRMSRRERGRFEISNVPAALRQASRRLPIVTRYERVTFDVAQIHQELGPRADLLAPGHPLHDAVADQVITRWGPSLERGSVLVSATIDAPALLIGLVEEVVDGTDAFVSRRFSYAFVDEAGTVTPAGPAPYLDCVGAPASKNVARVRGSAWLADAESRVTTWVIEHQLPLFLAEVRPRRLSELARVRELVDQRLTTEINRLYADAAMVGEAERRGDLPREHAASLVAKAEELEQRLTYRRSLLDQQADLSTRPPRVLTAALVVPLAMVEAELPASAPVHAVETKEVERRGVDLVLRSERALGRVPIEQSFTNPGFDILSEDPGRPPIRIEVKARLAGAEDFYVTHNEVITGKNAAPRYRLALVRVDPAGADLDEVRYIDDPFATTDLGGFDAMGVRGDWARTWMKGREPF